MTCFSGEWPDERKLRLAGRRRHGCIAFANADAGAMAMTEVQAHRAARELLDEGLRRR